MVRLQVGAATKVLRSAFGDITNRDRPQVPPYPLQKVSTLLNFATCRSPQVRTQRTQLTSVLSAVCYCRMREHWHQSAGTRPPFKTSVPSQLLNPTDCFPCPACSRDWKRSCMALHSRTAAASKRPNRCSTHDLERKITPGHARLWPTILPLYRNFLLTE